MSSSEAKSLSELFDEAMLLYEKINDPLDDSDNSRMLKTCIERLTEIERFVDHSNLFSDNETLDEVSTESLKFIPVPAMIAALLQQKRTGGDRKVLVSECIQWIRRFLKLTVKYGFCDERALESSDSSAEKALQFAQLAQRRAHKIESFKKKKALEATIKQIERLSADQRNEELVRKLYINKIVWWISTAQEDLESLQCELTVCSATEDEAALPPPKSRMTTVEITRETLKQGVFGLGYPATPQMSIDRFYDSLKAQGLMPNCSGTGQPNATTNDKQTTSSDQDDEDEEKLREKREFDDWKDFHWKGSGNRYNRS